MKCYDFVFANEKLSDYGFMICSFSSNLDDVWSGGELSFTTQKSPDSDKQTYYSSSYDEPLSATFQICKSPCTLSHFNPSIISREEYSALSRWLKRDDGYQWLQFDSEGYEDVWFNVYFNIEPIQKGGENIGFTLKMTADSPYGYGENNITYIVFEDKEREHTITNYSDKIGELYPTVVITPKEEGNITLYTGLENDLKVTEIANVKIGTNPVLRGEDDYYTNISNPNNFNYQFPIMANSYSDRTTYFKLSDDSALCDLTIVYRLVRTVTV